MTLEGTMEKITHKVLIEEPLMDFYVSMGAFLFGEVNP